jgi:hypothetical protein
MALAMVLAVFAIVVILGAALLTFSSQNYFVSGKVSSSLAAFYLAQGGMQYYETVSPTLSINPITVEIPDGSANHVCLIWKDRKGNIYFQGEVLGGAGVVFNQALLVAPGGSVSQWSEVEQ